MFSANNDQSCWTCAPAWQPVTHLFADGGGANSGQLEQLARTGRHCSDRVVLDCCTTHGGAQSASMSILYLNLPAAQAHQRSLQMLAA